MSNTYSLSELSRFMDWASSKGLMKLATAQSRKIAAQKVLGVLDPSEQEDLRGVDVEEVFQRFVNKNGTGFTPDSLATYRSRFQKALEDFLRYKQDPTSFKFGGVGKPANGAGRAPSLKQQTATSGRNKVEGRSPSPPTSQPSMPSTSHVEVVFPIPIRDGVVVRIHNLPANLTRSEAQRISAVVLALSVPETNSEEQMKT